MCRQFDSWEWLGHGCATRFDFVVHEWVTTNASVANSRMDVLWFAVCTSVRNRIHDSFCRSWNHLEPIMKYDLQSAGCVAGWGLVVVQGMRFMRLLVQSSMLVVMLIHSVMGCCWHHRHEGSCGHASLGATCPAAQLRYSRLSHHSGCEHEHHALAGTEYLHEESSDPASGGPSHQTPCEHANCTFWVEASQSTLPHFEMLALAGIEYRSELRLSVDQPIISQANFKYEPVTAASRCAVLQVWRI